MPDPEMRHLPNSAHPSPLELAKEKVTTSEVFRQYGLDDGGGQNPFRSPLREDNHASLSTLPGGKCLHDFATGETFDTVGQIMRILGCSASEAAKELIRIADLTPAQLIPRPAQPKKPLRIPALSVLSVSDLAEIQHLRGWPVNAGVEIAHQRGHIFVCTMIDDGTARRAWAITDSARRCIQVRRLDGKPWDWNGSKAWTLGGSIASWPIGAADIGNRRIVLFCEGGPDFLAAYAFAWLAGRADSVAVVCVPGASASIHPEALPFFAGKFVRIFEHADAAGSAAGQRWAAQLTQAGATVDGFTFDPPHKDLADLFAATDAESLNCPSDIFEGLTTEDSSCR